MKIPRDVSGRDLARRLPRFGYEVRRQTGSHMRLTSSLRGVEHHVTIPDHDDLASAPFAASSRRSRNTSTDRSTP